MEVKTPTIVAFSIFMLFVVLVSVFTVVLPMFQYGLLNVCWGRAVSDTKDIFSPTFESRNIKQKTISIGDCLAEMAFVNTNDVYDIFDRIDELKEKPEYEDMPQELEWIKENINCNMSKKGHIILTPALAEADVGGTVAWLIGGYVVGGAVAGGGGRVIGPVLGTFNKEKIKSIVQGIQRAGSPPVCISLDTPFEEDSPRIVPEKELDEICVRLGEKELEDGKEYTVEWSEGECKREEYEAMNIRITIANAKTYEQAGDVEAAIESYEDFLEESPESEEVPFVLLELGDLYRKKNEYPEAVGYFTEIIEDHPDSEEKGDAYLYRGLTRTEMAELSDTEEQKVSYYRSAMDDFVYFIENYPGHASILNSRNKLTDICGLKIMVDDEKCLSNQQYLLAG